MNRENLGDIPAAAAVATVTGLGEYYFASGDVTGDAVADLLVLQTEPDPFVAIYRGPFDGERSAPDATFSLALHQLRRNRCV